MKTDDECLSEFQRGWEEGARWRNAEDLESGLVEVEHRAQQLRYWASGQPIQDEFTVRQLIEKIVELLPILHAAFTQEREVLRELTEVANGLFGAVENEFIIGSDPRPTHDEAVIAKAEAWLGQSSAGSSK